MMFYSFKIVIYYKTGIGFSKRRVTCRKWTSLLECSEVIKQILVLLQLPNYSMIFIYFSLLDLRLSKISPYHFVSDCLYPCYSCNSLYIHRLLIQSLVVLFSISGLYSVVFLVYLSCQHVPCLSPFNYALCSAVCIIFALCFIHSFVLSTLLDSHS